MDKDFQSTIWTIIKKAKHQQGEAIEFLFSQYRAPVLNFILKQGFNLHDAEDLTQEVFLKFVKGDVLAKVEKERGRFRDLLLAVTKNVIKEYLRKQRALKRGKDMSLHSLEEPVYKTGTEDLLLKEVVHKDEKETFDKLWIENLISMAFARLREECKKEGTLYYEVLCKYLMVSCKYKDIADELGIKISDVKNYLHHGRLRLAGYIKNFLREYSISDEDYKSELKYFSRFLPEE